MVFASGGRKLFSGLVDANMPPGPTEQQDIGVTDLDTNRPLWRTQSIGRIFAVTASAALERLVLKSANSRNTTGELIVLDGRSGQTEGQIPLESDDGAVIQLSPNGQLLAIGGYRGRISLVNMQSRDYSRRVLPGKYQSTQRIEFSSDSQRLIIAHEEAGESRREGAISILDIRDLSVVAKQKFKSVPQTFAVSGDDALVAARMGDESIDVWRLSTGEVTHLQPLVSVDKGISPISHRAIAFSADAKYLFSLASFGRVLVAWDLAKVSWLVQCKRLGATP